MEETQVKLIGAEIVRLSLQPGDVLVLSFNECRRRDDLEHLRNAIQERFGVPVVVLTNGIELKAILNVSPECQELAADARAKAAEQQAAWLENVQNMLKEPSNA